MRILLLEDNVTCSKILASQLNKKGHLVDTVFNGQQGFLEASTNQYDLFLCDILMPHWDGFKFMEAAQVVCPHLPIVVISSSIKDRPDLLKKLKKHKNIIGFLPKPVDIKELETMMTTVKIQTDANIRKLARIVCTMGPASKSKKTIGQMILAGMDIVRLNFSHGSYEQHEGYLNTVRQAEKEWSQPIGVLMDLCGPKIRTGPMQDNGIHLNSGDTIILQAEPVEGTTERISTIAPELLPDLQTGDPILLDDGLMELKVEKPGKTEVVCRIVVGGMLRSNKGMNLPATRLSLPSVTDKDKRDLAWGLDHEIDFAALSFVRSAADIIEVKDIIKKAGKRDLKVIAKIEKPEAVENISEIIDATDVIMIARGDMGVELPAARVPRIQQRIIRMCWDKNTPVITATQMLDTMTSNARPTRAEVTDVSLAIWQGTDAVMLSGETAMGIDPVNVVRTMASIICEEERFAEIDWNHYKKLNQDTSRVNPALTAAATMGRAAAVMVLDTEGPLYRHLSKWNRTVPTLLITNSLDKARQSCIYKNIHPIIIEKKLERDEMVFAARKKAEEQGYLRTGDVFAVLEGERQTKGNINQVGSFQLIKVD
jgi:pyruvate kinase